LQKLSKMCAPGVSAWDIDQKAEKLILSAGGVPAFKGYRGSQEDRPFPSTICASVNEELVHGVATKDKILREGDIFSIDIGMRWPVKSGQKGYFTDTALTVAIGKIPQKTKKLMAVTQEALEVGIRACRIGGTIADIGRAIENYVRSQGKYGIVEDLVGHGVGHAVHEEPRVPNYYDKYLEKWKIEPGVVIAIEPMITLGSHKVTVADDDWTILTSDQSLCAHYEHTIVVTESGPVVATRRPEEF
jgi:methionyl aminopeptidase